MAFVSNICRMTEGFFSKYPYEEYPEILSKSERPYVCLLVEWNNAFVCIPFRSNIKHKEAFIFKHTKRSKISRSGLDYKKLVLTNDPKDIDTVDVLVDSDEYKISTRFMNEIVDDVTKYIIAYTEHISGKNILDIHEYDRKYKYSTIAYFHNELGL